MVNENLTFRLNINVLGVLLLTELLHTKYLRVHVQVVEHVSVLVAPQPFIFPIEADRFRPTKVLPKLIFVLVAKLLNEPPDLSSVVKVFVNGLSCQLGRLPSRSLSLP
jgi:hypothetical protein